MKVSDAALPWVLCAGCILATLVGALLAAWADRHLRRFAAGSTVLPHPVSEVPRETA